MGYEIITNEKNVARVKLDVSKEDFDAGIQKAYQKNKKQFKVDGFRPGKVPLKVIENKFGKSVFYEDALNYSFPTAYDNLIKAAGFKTCAQPVLVEINDMGDNGAVVTIDVSLYPEFEVCDYKGIKVGPIEYDFKEEDLDAEVAKQQDQQARMVPAEDETVMGDSITLDFVGSIDGVEFEGGSAKDYKLTLGTGTFIDNFEDQLVGHKPGEHVTVNVKFPDDYQMKDYAGKEAVFECDIKSVHHKELPAVDDDLAVDLGYESLDDMKAKLKEKLIKDRNTDLKQGALNKINDYLIENTEIDIPQACIDERVNELKNDNDNQLRMNGINPDDYYQYVMQQSGNDDPQMIYDVFAKQAVRDLKSEMIYTKIMETNDLKYTDEQYDEELEKYAKMYKQTLEELKTSESMEAALKPVIEYTLKMKNTTDFLLSQADTSEIEEERAEPEGEAPEKETADPAEKTGEEK